MILADTGVLTAYLRSQDPALMSLFQSLPAAICGTTRAEVLHGAKSSTNRSLLIAFLDTFVQVPTKESIWDDVGGLLSRLRLAGISVPFSDAVIASVAVDAGVELWTNDQHFALIQVHEPRLRLYSPKP